MTVTVRELKNVRPPLVWEPVQGEETTAFVQRKHERAGIPKEALSTVVFEAQQILGRCSNPKAPPQPSTGLVVGLVQSGKTLSFTTVTALAHDNGYALVVLIAGTLENLKQQTLERLKTDLELDAPGRTRPWALFHQPRANTSDGMLLQNHLRNWLEADYPRDKKRVCIAVVLKHPKRLAELRKCLKGLELSRIPTLIIDDEADQATLNTYGARNTLTGADKKSANYREALELKQHFPHHTYVQYTATPQANLLVSLVDELSPEFAELVSPGAGYVGGRTLFAPKSGYAKTIPDDQAVLTFAQSSSPPAALVEALRVYLLGACAAEEAHSRANRTMMVHPSQQTGKHNDYLQWLGELVASWRGIADSKEEELVQALHKAFEPAYADLLSTVGSSLPPFEALIKHLRFVLRSVMVREVNSTSPGSSPINWSTSEYWILVGGAKLDRGFTVEGLVVTYMPRPLATGNADSLQQRARFYGYKEKYLGYCRVYLQQQVRVAFERYVEHELDIHKSLSAQRGKALKEWARQFILDSSMKPTRAGVIGIPLTAFLAKGWIEPAGAHIDSSCVASNREVFDSFCTELRTNYSAVPAQEAYPDLFIDRRIDSKRNLLVEAVPLTSVLAFLREFRLGLQTEEVERIAAVKALEKLMEEGQTCADIFLISELEPSTRKKRKDKNLINQVAQGKSPAGTNDREKLTYGGDRSFIAPERVSLHLRKFHLRDAHSGETVDTDVPWYGVHIPEGLEKNYLVQSELS